MISWFEALGFKVNRSSKLGEGAFGAVYPVRDDGFQEWLIYKQGKKLNWATSMCEVGQVHREGNLVAASGEFHNLVNIVALVLNTKAKRSGEALYYLPKSKVEDFQKMLQDFPQPVTDFAVVGQLTERASGEKEEKTLTSAVW